MEIQFEGLKKTRGTYLVQFIESKVGSSVDSVRLEGDRQRLANLEMFSDAKYDLAVGESGWIVRFILFERQTIIPLFNFGGVRDNFWFQFGVAEANLFGRGNKLSLYYQYYDRSSISTYLVLDRIRGSRWGWILNLVRWGTIEPLFFSDGTGLYQYTNNNLGTGLLYHFDFISKVELSTALFTEEYVREDDFPIAEAPQRARTTKQLIKVIFSVDKLNYYYFQLAGVSNTLNTEAVYSYDGDPDFYIVFDEFRLFHRFSQQVNNALRFRAGISSNDVGPFAPFVLDSYLNIRGVGNRVDRGTAMFIVNEELRLTVFDRANLAAQTVGFADFGTWRNPGGTLSDLSKARNFEWYAGGGVRLIHKKYHNAILRIDYAIDVQTPANQGFVIGLGQYF